MANGSFETAGGWTFASTANPGGITTAQAHAGVRSARLGIVPAGFLAIDVDAGAARQPGGPERNLLGELALAGASYSTAYQTVAIPAGARTVTLTFWYKPGSQGAGGDFQRVLLLRPGSYGFLATLMKTLDNAAEWRAATFDLSAYRGQSVVLYFEVYNDNISAGPRTWMYVDEVSVRACGSVAALGDLTGVQPKEWLPLLMTTGD